MIFLRSIGGVRSLRNFSSSGPLILKTGDVFTEKRAFSDEDVINYSKPGAVYVSQSLQFKSPVYVGEEITGEVQATNIRKMKDRSLVKLSTKCFKKGEHLVIDGEAVAILPSLARE